MKITVKLFATLRSGRGKELMMEDERFTVSQLLEALSIKPEEIAILLINGRDGNFEARLADGDTVSLFPPVGGG